MNFGRGKVRSSGADVTGIVNQVSADGETSPVWFGLVWAIGADKLCIGGGFTDWHLVSANKKYCVGSFDAAADTLGEAAKFVGVAQLPGFL